MDHITEEALDNYALNRLDSEESDTVEQHLLVCVQCQDRLESLDALILGLRQSADRGRRPRQNVIELSRPRNQKTAAPRVLVVDDEAAIRRLVKAVLSDMGYQVAVASDGGEALDLCRTGECFDLVLSDVQMPGLDGHQLACQIAPMCPESRMILMNWTDDTCDVCPFTARCTRLRKPFRMEQLVQAVSDSLARTSSEFHRDIGCP